MKKLPAGAGSEGWKKMDARTLEEASAEELIGRDWRTGRRRIG